MAETTIASGQGDEARVWEVRTGYGDNNGWGPSVDEGGSDPQAETKTKLDELTLEELVGLEASARAKIEELKALLSGVADELLRRKQEELRAIEQLQINNDMPPDLRIQS